MMEKEIRINSNACDNYFKTALRGEEPNVIKIFFK
jgi:hypothetical protein